MVRAVEKAKGIAQVRFENGSLRLAEIHWYEATGIGKKEFKLQTDKDKLPCLLHSQKPRQLAFAAELGR